MVSWSRCRGDFRCLVFGPLLLVAAAVVLVSAGSSQAAFPGRNGLIAFDHSTGEFDQIFTMTRSGTQVRQLTSGPVSSASPAFSADGRQIVFERPPAMGNGGLDLWTMNADGSDQRFVAATKELVQAFPGWSPNGKEIVYSVFGSRKERGIWVIDSNGDHLRRISKGNDKHPVWSPNGRWIAFDRARSPGIHSLWVVPAKGGAARRLTGGGAMPEWSPDGRKILFGRIGGVTSSLWTMNANGSHAHPIGHILNYIVQRPAWSPNGREIVYDRNGSNLLYMIDANGKHQHVVPNSQDAGDPTWQPLG
jgi:TolB protein